MAKKKTADLTLVALNDRLVELAQQEQRWRKRLTTAFNKLTAIWAKGRRICRQIRAREEELARNDSQPDRKTKDL